MTQLVIVSSSSLSHPRKWRGIARSWYKLAENRWQSQENTSTERRSSDRTAVSVIQSNPPPTRSPPTNGRGRSATAGTLWKRTPPTRTIYIFCDTIARASAAAAAGRWHNECQCQIEYKNPTIWPCQLHCCGCRLLVVKIAILYF